MNVTSLRVKRTGVLLGLVTASVVAALLVPASANAAVGKNPGQLAFNPTTGQVASTPTWSTTTACNSAFSNSAILVVITASGAKQSASGTIAPLSGPISGTLKAPLSTIKSALLGGAAANGQTFEFVVECQDASGNQDPEQSEFMTFSTDGTSYNTSSTPPSTTVSTTTTVGASPTTAASGANVTLSATVAAADTAGNDAVGQVEFFNGSTSLGKVAVSGGTASMVTNSLPVGADPITATFEPTDSTKFSTSTSTAVTVTVTNGSGGGGNTETINVNVAANSTGSLALTVSNTPVSMSAPTNTGTLLDSTGTLSPVTVSDSRLPTHPGWSSSGSVGDFVSGANSFSGNDLGWSPSVTTQDAAADVTAGTNVAAGNPGLKTPAVLASAGAGKGFGTTVLGAGLDLQIPFTTPAGAYAATLTLTLVSN